MRSKILFPVNEPRVYENEERYLTECIKSKELAAGQFVDRFENEFAKHLNLNFSQSVSNGTAALEVALFACGVKPGDEVIMPSFTIISCAIAVLRIGAIPIFVDVNSDTLTIEAKSIEPLITKRTTAIMVVHIYGHPCDMDPIMELSEIYKLKVIEDTAEAHGAEYKGHLCGSIGHVSTFSFYANKHITSGEGGMVATNSFEINQRAGFYKNLCFEPNDRFHHNELGYNFRLSNLQCAVGLAQLENLSSAIEHKIKCGERYKANLGQLPFFDMQTAKSWAKQVYWVYCIRIRKEANTNAKEVMRLLLEKGVETRPFFKGMHAQPALQKLGLCKKLKYPVSDLAYKMGFYLPSGLNLSMEDIDEISNIVEEVFLNLAR